MAEEPAIQGLFAQFERESFKYQQALREIEYGLLSLDMRRTEDIIQQLSNINCQIDDLHGDFDRFRASELEISGIVPLPASTAASISAECQRQIREQDESWRADVWESAEYVDNAALDVADRLALQIEQLEDGYLNVKDLSQRDFNTCCAGDLTNLQTICASSVLVQSSKQSGKPETEQENSASESRQDTCSSGSQIPLNIDKEGVNDGGLQNSLVDQPCDLCTERDEQASQCQHVCSSAVNQEFTSVIASETAHQEPLFFDDNDDRYFGLQARDMFQICAVAEAIIFPLEVANREAEYRIEIISPYLRLGSAKLRQQEILRLFRPAFLEVTHVTEFELNCAYAIVCHILRSKSEFFLDAPDEFSGKRIAKNTACYWPRITAPPYCMLVCEMDIRKAYVNSIEYIANVAVPYSFERPLLSTKPRPGGFTKLQPEEEGRINDIIGALLSACAQWIHAQVK